MNRTTGKSLFWVFAGISMLLIKACAPKQTDTQTTRDIINFNQHWEFVRLNTDSTEENLSTSTKNGVQTDASWDSQFNVEHLDNLPTKEQGDSLKQIIQNELQVLPQQPWENVTLPHAAFVEPKVVKKQWEGICYYQKEFTLNPEDKSRKIFLEFEGAMQLADVWVNGQHLAHHAGGYLPFTVDISPAVNFDSPNTVLVRLDNRDHPLIPPGKPLERLDFNYFHGLYRDVHLIKTQPVHITDAVAANEVAGGGVFVQYSEVSEQKATIHIKTHVRNDSKQSEQCSVISTLLDPQGKVVGKQLSTQPAEITTGEAIHFEQSMEVTTPQLWSPDDPSLYTLQTSVILNGQEVDQRNTRIGIRWLAYSRDEGFQLNGKKIRLVGTNRHMEYPYVGNALSDNAQYRDLYKIKKAGFNTVRLGHYPQDPSVLAACDELGLLAINPIPGWQFFNKDSVFVQRTYQNIRDMVRRDRNHPSVILWETILNEAWPPAWWKDEAQAIAHQEYPGPQMFTAGDMYGYYGWDILYNDWKENHTRPNDSEKPGFIREYGDYEFGGHYSTTRKERAEGEEALLQAAWNFQWSHNKHRSQYPWTIGDATWVMYDYNRGCCDDIEASGVSDIFRLPKFTYQFFKSQRAPEDTTFEGGPMAYIANYWTERTSPGKVIVYSNCEEVELFLNGKSLGKHKPDQGPDTIYGERTQGGNPFDGGNAQHLTHPPFTFTDVTWEAGTLSAVGYIQGKKATEYLVHTPTQATGIQLDIDISGKPLEENDLVFVYASIVDKQGNPVPTSSALVEFEIEGDAHIVGPAKVHAEAGIATLLLRTSENAQSLVIKAASAQLNTAETHYRIPKK
ncbi:glycoside hydrolase family 2 TIM barrel-domain containing protein [Rapidithrix thailandica]|uniref:Glycoside hydrolase family 2 TIM barrel-domain containing protein n=1 Tax=Rapidithrix thailandica TaxID=413964 RepID=A0AAW9S9B0_9BACT